MSIRISLALREPFLSVRTITVRRMTTAASNTANNADTANDTDTANNTGQPARTPSKWEMSAARRLILESVARERAAFEAAYAPPAPAGSDAPREGRRQPATAPSAVFTLRLGHEELEALQRRAACKQVAPSALARTFIRQGLRQPAAPVVKPAPLRSGIVLTIGVLALQGDVREHLRALTAAGADAVTVRRPAELERLDGLVLPGGESTTIVKLARTFGLLEPLRERIAAGLPVYGSCAGMILLADRVDTGGDLIEATFGGIDITVRRNAFGRQVDSFEEDIAIEGVDGDPVRAVFIRAPWVQQLGPAATALGHTAAGHVVAVRQGLLLATSFHPEMTGDLRLHALFVRMAQRRVGSTDGG